MQPPPFLHACRGDALDKFGVVNLQLHQLTEELRPLLKFYAVHPKARRCCCCFRRPALPFTPYQ